MAVFVGTDRIQHALWHLLFPSNGNKLSKEEERMRELAMIYYQKIDDNIGRIIRAFQGKANFIIMSDHGFGPLLGKFYINKWLEELGLLSFKPLKTIEFRLKARLSPSLRKTARKIDFLNLRNRRFKDVTRKSDRMNAYSFLECIDWSKSLAYAASNTEQGIYVNLKGREPFGIVRPGKDMEKTRSLIIKALAELTHPVTKKKVVSKIFKKEDLYSGPYANEAPDVVFFLGEGEYLADVQPMSYLYQNPNWKTGTGTHRMDGIFIAQGSDIRRDAQIRGARIVDLAPTILNLLDVPIPSDMEGRVLSEALTDDLRRRKPPVFVEYPESKDLDPLAGKMFSNEEQKRVEQELKGLGYL
jgi:predicted AlkP superfamily phosphohydrolase/phosphomutase